MKYNRIKEELEQTHKSQKWLSDQLDISVVSVSNWCQNHKQPSIKTLFEISKILKTTPDKLINNKIG